MNETKADLARLLSGGDLRSTGAAGEVARGLLDGRWKADDALRLIESAPPVVRMRAADALEKASRSSPALIAGIGPRLLDLLAKTQPKEVRWHLLQMAPRLQWPCLQHSLLMAAIESAFEDTSAIVQTSALQALSELSTQSPAFASAFKRRLKLAECSRLPSMRARARKLANNED